MRRFVIILLAAALVIGGLVSWFASTRPDGLERVAVDQGFDTREEESSVSVFPDYTVPGFGGFCSRALAGLIGVVATFGVVIIAGRLIARRSGGG